MRAGRGIDTRAAGTRVLLIDNYSSFTFNLYQLLAEITGVLPRVVANDSGDKLDLEDFDVVVLSPGPGSAEKAGDFGICRELLSQDTVPVLGVCLGHQGLGVLEGADLQPLSQPYHGRTSTIVQSGAALFQGLPERFVATRYHSLVLHEPLPASLECVARSEDGEIMALRHRTRPHWGVQFHPESVCTEYGHKLLTNFCALRDKARPEEEGQHQLQVPIERKPTRSKRWRGESRELAGELDTSQIFETLFADAEESFWLDGEAQQGHSYLGDSRGARSYGLRYCYRDKVAEFSGCRSETRSCDSIFDLLEEELSAKSVQGAVPGFSFVGGFVGYLGYEVKAELGFRSRHASPFPDAHWIWADRFVAYDHEKNRATLVMLVPADASNSESENWFDEVERRLAEGATAKPMRACGQELCIEPRESQEAYESKIATCQEHIARGESYELCLTTQIAARLSVDPYQLFQTMRAQNPAPYSAYLRTSSFALVSASPERFLRIDADGWVESKPIKGTARRDADEAKDKALAEALQESEKEQAENLMIVDLVRNDLGKSCEIGSVEVSELAALESFATVHQLVSTIRGRLRADVSPLHCVRDAFPGGSMTGAPKRRSMEILDALEEGARGPYSGSLGFLSCDGAVDLSIVIRSVMVEEERVHMGVGGAITSLSQSASEFAELQLKASAQLRALRTLCE